MRSTRRGILGGFGVVAVVLVCASVAYACTIFKGSFTVELSGGGISGTRTQTVYGDASMSAQEMYWCTGTNNGAGVPDTEPTWGALTMNHSTFTDITITMADATSYNSECLDSAGTNKMKDGSGYDLDYRVGLMPSGAPENHNCHASAGQHLIIPNVTITNGAGFAVDDRFKTLGQENPGYISICLYDEQNRPDGAAVNIDVL